MDLPSAFAVQVSMAFGLHLFSMLGVPVSTSQAVVGSLLGVGLVQGIRTVSVRKLAEIAIGWVLVPTLAGGLSFAVFKVVTLIQSN